MAFQNLKRACKKAGERFFVRVGSDRTMGNRFKLEEGTFRLDIWKIFFYNEGVETLEKVAQRRCECPIIGSIQGLVGQGLEQPDLVKDVFVHGRGVGQNNL